MVVLSNPLIQDFLDAYFLNEDSADGGAAALWRGAASAGDLQVNLYSVLPSAGGAGTLVAYTGYDGVTATRSATDWTRSSQRMSNVLEFDFGERTNSGAAVVSVGWGISITDDDTTPQFFGPHWSADSIVAVTDDGGTLNGTPNTTNTLVAADHGLLEDDEVMVMAAGLDGIPSNLSPGTVYYVISTVTTDTFQLSTGLAGSAIDVGPGAIRCAKAITISITENLTPKIAAGALQIYG
ncbi:MAG: hypothetical protein GY944_08610 [bacterium]|nr:hypothetical protein [bacterium]